MGYIRHPRVVVVVNGLPVVPIECDVYVSQHQSSDTFHATLPLDTPGDSFWADTAPMDVQIMATNNYLTGAWVEMIQGSVDHVDCNFTKRTAMIRGRDRTAKLTDTKTTEKWQNKKPEEIITELAGRAGLGAQILGQSKDKAGLKYKDDYNRISEHDNLWNVIVRLAKHMGCIAFVKGNNLVVRPFDGGFEGQYTITYTRPTGLSPAQGNVVDLSCTRNLNLSKTVKVNHKSWQHKEGKGIESEYQSSGVGGELEYTFKAANLTKAQQDQLCETKLNEILSHERTPIIKSYGDVNINPMMKLILTGTGTGFDQEYIMNSIHHHWDDHGYKMDINVRNKDKKRGGATQSR